MRIPLFRRMRRGTAIDPVCNMKVHTNNPPGGTWEYERVTHYFCGPGCNRAFQKEPEAYLSGEKSFQM